MSSASGHAVAVMTEGGGAAAVSEASPPQQWAKLSDAWGAAVINATGAGGAVFVGDHDHLR